MSRRPRQLNADTAAMLRSAGHEGLAEQVEAHDLEQAKRLTKSLRKKRAVDPVDALAKLKAKAGVRLTKKSIINTATRGDEEKQRIATPWSFIHALEQRFGVPVDFDLAADKDNAKARDYFDDVTDSLSQDWSDIVVSPLTAIGKYVDVRLPYLNPPYTHIKPWARKLADCRWLKRWTVMLVPASYSTDWFLELRGKVQLDAIPRIQFEGATHLYPKDLVLCVAGFGVCGEGYWDWRASYVQYCEEVGIEPDPVYTKGVRRFPAVARSVVPDFNWSPDPFYQPQTVSVSGP